MNDGGAPRIDLVGVDKRYSPGRAEEVHALREVGLALPAGSFVSVEGPSGCGKTTLLNLLGLLDVPTRGEIRWDGVALAARTERERARLRLTSVGFIFQRFYLMPNLTAQENVELPMRALGRNSTARAERSRRLLEQVGLTGRARAFPHELSGGEEQRVAIARALANGPGLLLADEPTGELDSGNSEVVLGLIRDAQRATGATVVLVTHNPVAAAITSRHLTMRDGRVVGDSGSGA